MRYHNIAKDDMLNGDGIRAVLFVSGCTHHCPECHNPITWNKNGGINFDDAAKAELFAELEKSYVSGVTFSGGDPLAIYNRDEVLALIKEIKEKYPDKTVWVYSGWKKSELENQGFWNELSPVIDVFVEGRFEIAHKSEPYNWAGSTNQRVLRKESNFTINTSDPVYVLMEEIKTSVKYAPPVIKGYLSSLADNIVKDSQLASLTDREIRERIASLSNIGIDDFDCIFDSEMYDDFQNSVQEGIKKFAEYLNIKYSDAELESLLSDFAIFESNNPEDPLLPDVLNSIKTDVCSRFDVSDSKFDNWCISLNIKTKISEVAYSLETSDTQTYER